MRRTGATTLTAVLLCGGLLAGCGGSGDSSSLAQQPAPAAADAAAGAADAVAAPAVEETRARSGEARAAKAGADSGATAAGAGEGVRATVADAALAGREIIYTADLTVRVDDVDRAVTQVENAAEAAGGLVVSSERSSEPGGEESSDDRSRATLKLRVPPASFDSVLSGIARAGAVLDRTLSGQDVTTEVVDVNSRIASQRKSVARIRDLMDQATTLRDIVSLETEVAQREADLEALLARQAKLREATTLATITARLVSNGAAAKEAATPVGFSAGLRSGWDAFTGALLVAATVLGALLPFAVTLAVLGPPVAWFVLRLRRAAGAAAVGPEGRAG